MKPTTLLLALTTLTATSTQVVDLKFNDTAVQPQPVTSYKRYLTLYHDGNRTYTCDPNSSNTNYSLTDFTYNMYPNAKKAVLIGQHVHTTKPDPLGGFSIFYTKYGGLTYWLGFDSINPGSPNGVNLGLEQQVGTERSEPKFGMKYDLGQADYVTRSNAVGGSGPKASACVVGKENMVVASTCYYSFWKRIA